jgi:hypothetical protein
VIQLALQALRSPKFFPCLNAALSAMAAIRYVAARDMGHGIYWAVGTGFTLVVTFLLKG